VSIAGRQELMQDAATGMGVTVSLAMKTPNNDGLSEEDDGLPRHFVRVYRVADDRAVVWVPDLEISLEGY
jgi:hypothetical protein